MNPKLKRIFLYFAIVWALVIGILWIIAIWWNINEDIILRTLATYFVLFIAFIAISWSQKLYDKFKGYPEIASAWSWLLIISIGAVAVLICMDIWQAFMKSDLIRKIIATIGVINFSMLIFVFSINKWGDKASE